MAHIVFTDKEDFVNTFEQFSDITTGMRNTLGNLISAKEITVECPSISPLDGRWDGLLLVKYQSVPTAYEVINNIVQFCRADQVCMVDEKTLSLWWD